MPQDNRARAGLFPGEEYPGLAQVGARMQLKMNHALATASCLIGTSLVGASAFVPWVWMSVTISILGPVMIIAGAFAAGLSLRPAAVEAEWTCPTGHPSSCDGIAWLVYDRVPGIRRIEVFDDPDNVVGTVAIIVWGGSEDEIREALSEELPAGVRPLIEVRS